VVATELDAYIHLEHNQHECIDLQPNEDFYLKCNFPDSKVFRDQKQSEYRLNLPINLLLTNKAKRYSDFEVYISMNTKEPSEKNNDL